MDFELNKILGAILGTLLFVMALGFIAEAIYAPRASGPGYNLPAPSAEASGQAAAPVVVADIGTLLAKADPKAGEAAAKKCESCHDFSENGPNKIGPNLYGVVGRPIASHAGFSYSADLSAHASETWTYAKLNQWITNPRSFAAGTKMTYAGDTDDSDRANIIAYLSTLSHSPVPFPPPAAPSGGQAPASGQVTSGVSEVPSAPGSQSATDVVSASQPAGTSSAAAAEPVSSEAASASAAPASSAAAPASSEAPSSSSAQ
jgi:cytochrome c